MNPEQLWETAMNPESWKFLTVLAANKIVTPLGGPVHTARRSGAYPVGQRSRVLRKGGSGVARETWRGNAICSAGQSLGERIHQVIQREAAGRAAEPGDFLHAEGGPYPDRAVEAALQWSKAA